MSVQHGIHIAHFRPVTVIFHQPVGLKRIGAYLTAKGNGILARIVRLPGGVALAAFMLVQARLKDAHSRFLITVL